MPKVLASLFLLTFSLGAYSADGWQNYMPIIENYFEGLGDNHRIVLVMDSNFHQCGWNTVADIRLDNVGETAFKSYVSVVLTAIVANKAVSIRTVGCREDRARAIGMKIAN